MGKLVDRTQNQHWNRNQHYSIHHRQCTTITPSTLLAANTKYTIALHSGCVIDYAGNPLVGVVRYFTTGNT